MKIENCKKGRKVFKGWDMKIGKTWGKKLRLHFHVSLYNHHRQHDRWAHVTISNTN